MNTHGFHPSEVELCEMIRNVDKSESGAIDFNEFIEMTIKEGLMWRMTPLMFSKCLTEMVMVWSLQKILNLPWIIFGNLLPKLRWKLWLQKQILMEMGRLISRNSRGWCRTRKFDDQIHSFSYQICFVRLFRISEFVLLFLSSYFVNKRNV